MPMRPRIKAKTKTDLLRTVPLFEHCSKRDLARIAGITDEVDVPAGKVLITEGDRGREFFVIVSGEAEVRRRGRKVATLTPGMFFGEMALLSHRPRTATVTAASALHLLVIADRAFVELLDALPELWLKVARSLAERVAADDVLPG